MAEESLAATNGEIFSEGQLLDHYRVESFTGFSSIGEIYSAIDENTQQSCSLHVISSALSEYAPEVTGQLLQKARNFSSFRHKFCARVQNTFSHSGVHCIVTEHISGISLREMQQRSSTPAAAAPGIIRQAAQLLAAAENVPAARFDLIPDNIFVDAKGNIKVLSPGIISHFHLFPPQLFQERPALQQAVAFIAPEILFRKETESFQSSCYALGALITFCFTGCEPFTASTSCSSMARSLAGTEELSEEMPPRMAALAARCLSKDPAERPANAGALCPLLGVRTPLKTSFWKAAASVLLLGGVIYALGLYLNTFASPEKNHRSRPGLPTVRTVPAVLPKRTQPSPPPSSSSAASPKALPRSWRPPYSLPPVQKSGMNFSERLDYCRRRLSYLQKELVSKELPPRYRPLLKRRIQFRKGQIRRISELLSGKKSALRPGEEKFFTAYNHIPESAERLAAFLLEGNSVTSPDLFPPLIAVIAQERLDLLPLLITAEAFTEQQDKEGRTALFHARLLDSFSGIQRLIEAGANTLCRDKFGHSPQHYHRISQLRDALLNLKYREIDSLSRSDMDLNYPFAGGENILIACVRSGKFPAVRKAIDISKFSSTLINHRDDTGRTALFWSCKLGHRPIFRLLFPFTPPTELKYFWQELCLKQLEPKEFENPQLQKILSDLLRSKKIRLEEQQLLDAVRSKNVPLFRFLLRHWPVSDSDALGTVLQEALEHRMPADIICDLLRRNVPRSEPQKFSELISYLKDDALIKSFLLSSPAADQQEKKEKAEGREIPEQKAAEESPPPAPVPSHFRPRNRIGKIVTDTQLARKLLRSIENQDYNTLRSLLTSRLDPDSIVSDMTLLQHAASRNHTSLISLLLQFKADPFKHSHTVRLYPVSLAVKNRSLGAFLMLNKIQDVPQNVHIQVLETILQNGGANNLFIPYLRSHADAIKKIPVCFMTMALRHKASTEIIVALMRLYRNFEAPKHRSVLQQAIASQYKPAVIKTLLNLKVNTQKRSHVTLFQNNSRQVRRLTPLETARAVKAPRIVFQLLRQKGVRER